jgi:hypothetical protein
MTRCYNRNFFLLVVDLAFKNGFLELSRLPTIIYIGIVI